MTETWRCFVAVPVGEELRASLSSAVAGWRTWPELAPLRWVEPESWHLTIAFLGAVRPGDVPTLAAAISAAVVGAIGTSEHPTGGLGGFPSARRARVAWYGVGDRDARLQALASAVRAAVGHPGGEPFRPHVTMARARSGEIDLRRWASSEAPAGTLVVDRLELMRSHLGSGPARHEALASVDLAVAAGV